MKRETQIVIWQFILAFKQKTGEQANYLDLVKKAGYREGILDKARRNGDPTLSDLANQVESGLAENQDEHEEFEDESESVLLAEAPDEAWAEPTSDNSATSSPTPSFPSAAEEKAMPPAERYAYRLRGALKRKEFSLLHRRALDRFAHKNGLMQEQVLDIENRTRESLKLPPLSWARELTSVITDLREHHDSLTTLKSQLQHTYVRAGRLDDEEFQLVYTSPAGTQAATPAPSPEPTPQPGSNKSNRTWIVLAVVVLLGLAALSQL